ncbi:uncharacterized protein [Onthophagus taurus]|uniref:uncharacterized protein n=1 Tax=Onthophagus taurus TaxID=166361 RepID=UPI000C2070B1|nr:uncharacterized protein LOC111414440 [Onthophagus taurus]
MGEKLINDWLTVYLKDYDKKVGGRSADCRVSPEFKDPMGESFRQYLKLEPKDLGQCEEHYEEYLKTIKTEHPKLHERYFSTPVDEKLIKRNMNLNKQSVYQVDYCDMEKCWEEARQADLAHQVHLPDDLFIPLTTSAFVYRNPTDLQKDVLKSRFKIEKPQSKIGMSREIQKILKITTGETEYDGVIGELGQIIIDDEMHGKMIHPPCGCAQHPIVPEEEKK